MTSTDFTGFRPSGYPGAAYKARRDGGMLVTYDSHTVRIFCNGPSELPWAAEKTRDVPHWVRTRGGSAFSFRELMESVQRYRALQATAHRRGREFPARPRIEAYAAFLSHFDPAHLHEIADYRLRAFNLYCAIRRCPGLFDIMCSGTRHDGLAGGGALAYALSNIAGLAHPTPRRPFDLMRRLVRRKRREIAIALGFPAQHASLAVNALGRMPRIGVTTYTVETLRHLLRRGDTITRKRLAHCDRISEALLRVMSDPEIEPMLTASLLDEFAHASPQGPIAVHGEQLIADTVRLLDARGARIPRLRSYADVVDLHDAEIMRRTHGRVSVDARPLPAAPVPELPGQIEYVSHSTTALHEEGLAMHNCVGTYARLIARGERFIYRVLQPERCTLAIILGFDLRFHIRELKAMRNTEPKLPATRVSIEQWLHNNHDPKSVNRLLRSLDGTSAIARGGRTAEPDPWDTLLPRYEGAARLDSTMEIPF